EDLELMRPGFEVLSTDAPVAPAQIAPVAPVEAEDHFWRFIGRNVFSSYYIWLLSLANFFVYIIIYAFMAWGQTVLKESKGVQLSHGGWMMAAFEGAGALGAIFGGWLSDRFLGGRAARTCVVYMILCGISIWLFWKWPGNSHLATTGWLCATGFFIYGPQCL